MSAADTAMAPAPGRPALRIRLPISSHSAGGEETGRPSSRGASVPDRNAASDTSP